MIKKSLVFFLVLSLLIFHTEIILAQPQNQGKQSDSKYVFQGHIELNDKAKSEKDIFTGKTAVIKNGTVLKMTVSNVISSGYSVEGDEFFAEVVNDLDTADGVAVPAGTIAHGKITTMKDSKRLGRDAYVNLKFDYLVTPDGREIPIDASMTTRKHAATSVAKVVAEDTVYAVGGGLIGGLLALKYLGLGSAVATHGGTVAGGAGVGAAIGTGVALARKGSELLIAPGDEIKVKLSGKLNLPTISEEALKDDEKFLNGLDVKITSYALEKDPFGELNTITLGLTVVNKTLRTFSSFDMALMNDYDAVYYPSPFGNADMWFTKISPNTRIAGKLSFSVDNPKRKHWLVFYDTRTRQPLAKISIANAQKQIRKAKKESKKS